VIAILDQQRQWCTRCDSLHDAGTDFNPVLFEFHAWTGAISQLASFQVDIDIAPSQFETGR
jgi:hypothetical protein